MQKVKQFLYRIESGSRVVCGCGFRTDNIHINSPEWVRNLIRLAPDYEAWVLKIFSENERTTPCLED